MAFIETIGTLTVAAGQNYSTILSQSSFSRYDVLGIFAPASGSGSATLQAAPAYEVTASITQWAGALNGATAITVAANKTVFLESFPYEMIRLSSSVAPSVNEVYTIKGQFMGSLTGLAVLNG